MRSRDELLAAARSAFVAAHTDYRVIDRFAIAGEEMAFLEFREYCEQVWEATQRPEPIWVHPVELLSQSLRTNVFADSAAQARWALPGGDLMGIPRTGSLAGTTGLVAYVDVKEEGRRRLIGLHEIAHLLVDTEDKLMGHGHEWVAAYIPLIHEHLGEEIALRWEFEHQWWTDKASEHIAEDPEWLSGMLN